MLLFSDGAFLSGFCTEVLRREFCSESCTARVLHRECFGASPVCPCGVNVKVHADGEETFIYCLNDSLYNLVRLVLRNIARKYKAPDHRKKGAAPPQINCNGTAPSVEPAEVAPTAVEPYEP